MKEFSYFSYAPSVILAIGWASTIGGRCGHNSLIHSYRCNLWLLMMIACAAYCIQPSKFSRERLGIAVRYIISGILPYGVIAGAYYLDVHL